LDAPKSHGQAVDMAFAAATRYVDLVVELSAARALLALRKQGLEYVRAKGVGDLDIAVFKMEHAEFEVLRGKEALERFSIEISAWSSGPQFDDSGCEYTFAVSYLPRYLIYRVIRCDEGGKKNQADYSTLEEAIAHAERILYPQELDMRPAPRFSFDESTAAGEIVITFHGQAVAIKSIVDRMLDEVDQRSGQQYEIFIRCARNVLDELPLHVGNAADREALEKYLAYDRF
jgi:hypothetical protein